VGMSSSHFDYLIQRLDTTQKQLAHRLGIDPGTLGR